MICLNKFYYLIAAIIIVAETIGKRSVSASCVCARADIFQYCNDPLYKTVILHGLHKEKDNRRTDVTAYYCLV